jgi:hypothetical protein
MSIFVQKIHDTNRFQPQTERGSKPIFLFGLFETYRETIFLLIGEATKK